MTTVSMSRERHQADLHTANMIGAYCFWTKLIERVEPSERTEEWALAILGAIAGLAFESNGGTAHTEKESEVYRLCGLEPVKETWREK
ncbi:MAG TPA: hypothetical protein VKB77_16030 [Terriglobales bacterium]|nr:hypothetical protein [Terriglobales bacterium]